ncbi:hypothetical protein ALC62_03020 [Cyphomyrmex costatus]|uniref:DUF4817 domain-containing protein n=1 Tax=Cyphomyrmex costatus TaxID=456900 RepID=A0A151IMB4_9HYME|nr:hypothetical protein ALC62_03020 [Cyphomyrmex costatus]
MYSYNKKIHMLLIFSECKRNAREIAILYATRYPQRHHRVQQCFAPGRRTSMADNNRGVSVVSLPPPPSPPPPPPPPPSLPSPTLLAIVVALRARRAVVSGAHRVHMYTTYLSPFSEINKQCRGYSCRAPAEKVVPCLMFLIPQSDRAPFFQPHHYRRFP